MSMRGMRISRFETLPAGMAPDPLTCLRGVEVHLFFTLLFHHGALVHAILRVRAWSLLLRAGDSQDRMGRENPYRGRVMIRFIMDGLEAGGQRARI